MPDRDELDRLIDSELARYGEPRFGLEQRILARVRQEKTPKLGVFGHWQSWVLGGAVTAMALLCLVQVQRTTHRETNLNIARSTNPNHALVSPKTKIPETHIPIPQLQPTAKPTRPVARRSKSIQAPETVQRPKLDVFPAPQPLTDQEQALAAIATAKSDSARENLIASQRELDTPLQISSLAIPPITTPHEGNK